MKQLFLICFLFSNFVGYAQLRYPAQISIPLSTVDFVSMISSAKPDSVQKELKTNTFNFIENSWFVDGLVGFNGLRSTSLNTTAFSVAGRVGKKWYLGELNKWQFGAQATFMRMGLSFGLPQNISGSVSNSTLLYFAPSAGFINAIQFNEKYALEANLNVGFNMMFTFFSSVNGTFRQDATIVQPGFMMNPCVKFRIKSLAIGLDIAVLYSGAANYKIIDNSGGSLSATANAGTLYITSITLGKTF